MNKTAMQLMLDYLLETEDDYIFGDETYQAHQKAISKATELLDKEKNDIMDANDDGYNECVKVAKGDSKYDLNYAETYYQKTYNQ